MTDKKTVNKILGENIKRIRQEKGVSRKDLAEKLGVSEVSISTYENGQKQPPLEKIFSIADFLKVSVASLTGENDYSDNVPNVEKIVGDEIFEYRFERAINMANCANYSPQILSDGQIVISAAKEFKHADNGIIYFSGGHIIKFKDKKDFVEAMEAAERFALVSDLTFNESMIIFREDTRDKNSPPTKLTPNVEKWINAIKRFNAANDN